MGRSVPRPIRNFLEAREGKFDPSSKEVRNLQRLAKIDFTGTIHLSDKGSKTDMIVIHPGDLVISGINVAKGAVAVYDGNEPIAATIHYSSYRFDSDKVEIEYFRRYLKSEEFISALEEQVKGGIKTEIKAKTFLSIQIPLPAVAEQRVIANALKRTEKELGELSYELEKQESIQKSLRQSILQEAIEGRLTAAWRAKHPYKKGDPERDGAALLENIKEEKKKLVAEGKIRKEKLVMPIAAEEEPFALPEGWVWCRLGHVGSFERGKSKHRPRNDPRLFQNGSIPFIQTGEVAQSRYSGFRIISSDKYYNESGLAQSRLWPKGTLCITIAANIAETGFLEIDACFPDSVVGFISLTGNATSWLIRYFLSSVQDEVKRYAPATAQKNINLDIINDLLFPLPPLAEQAAIVERVESLLATVSELEKEVASRKELAAELMREVLREAFEG